MFSFFGDLGCKPNFSGSKVPIWTILALSGVVSGQFGDDFGRPGDVFGGKFGMFSLSNPPYD